MTTTTRCGFVAIIGRPNVGKSTLLNKILGQKISITSAKPQTTRHRILGINSEGDEQIIFVDTPGMHLKEQFAMNRYLNRTAIKVLNEVDIIILVLDPNRITEDDEWILEKMRTVSRPIILVLNKVDKLANKDRLLPMIEKVSAQLPFAAIVPLSATKGDNVPGLVKAIKELLPENPFFYPPDQITDRSERFLAAEIIREKVMRATGDEVPYAMTIELEHYKVKNKILHISAIIWVEKPSQKAIIIGEGGERLKSIGIAARRDIETMIEQKVFLRLWCKVKEGWSDDERALKSLGYREL